MAASTSGTPFSSPYPANEPILSEYISSSPSRRTSPLLSDMAAIPHISRFPSPSHPRSVRSVSGSAALSTPRLSPSSSVPRAHDMDHHHHHSQGRERSTTLQRVATGFRRLTRTSDVPAFSEDDWSVFGEAMAHEVVQPQPQPPPPPLPVPTLLSAPVDDEACYASIRQTQSPVSDANLEDFIPSVEERRARRELGDGEQDEEGSSSLDTGLLASRSHVESSDTESTSLASPEDTNQWGQSPHGGKSWWMRLTHLPTLPTLYRNILKCSVAYFLGSLFTYYAPLSRFISELTQDGPGEKYPSAMGHMVATV